MKITQYIYLRSLITFNIKLRFIFVVIFLHNSASQDFQSIIPNILEEGANLVAMNDNEDINYIATSKQLYSGLKPEKIFTFPHELPSNAVIAQFDQTFFVAACTSNSLLEWFNIDSGETASIKTYNSFGLGTTNDICCLSILASYVYIIHTVTMGSSFDVNFIKFKLAMINNKLAASGSANTFMSTLTLNTQKNFNYFSCESIHEIKDNSIDLLFCSYINVNTGSTIYSYMGLVADFSSKKSKVLFESETLEYFKIQRINSTFIRYILGNNSYEIYLTKSNDNYEINIVPEGTRNENLYSFYSYKDLFYYNNEYIFHATPTDETNLNYNLYITNSLLKNNLITIAINKPIEKVLGFNDKENQKFIYIYQYSNKIEYFTLELKCFYNAWYIDVSNNSIICYDDKDCFRSNLYYYHTNTRECTLSNCMNGYFQFNFECYKDNCPENTELISLDGNKCKSTLDYCYIDPQFKTHCSNEQFNDYFLRYENTKLYFKCCDNSSYFFNIKTYLYQNTCLSECPSQLISNDESGLISYSLTKNLIKYSYKNNTFCYIYYYILKFLILLKVYIYWAVFFLCSQPFLGFQNVHFRLEYFYYYIFRFLSDFSQNLFLFV